MIVSLARPFDERATVRGEAAASPRRVARAGSLYILARQALRMCAFLLRHPANRGKRVRQFGRAVAFQLRGRVLGRPTLVPLGESSHILAEVHDYSATLCVYANPPDYFELRHWAVVLHPGDLFIDVGANVGTYTIWAAEHGASVISVEPDPEARRRLRRNLALNGYEADIVPLALANRPGRTLFTVGRGQTNRFANSVDTEAVSVEATTLDELIGNRFVAGVKIDVEGAERLVLEGAARALSEGRIRLLQLEWNARSLDLLGEGRRPVADLLESHGYRLFRPGRSDADPSAMSDADMFAEWRRGQEGTAGGHAPASIRGDRV